MARCKQLPTKWTLKWALRPSKLVHATKWPATGKWPTKWHKKSVVYGPGGQPFQKGNFNGDAQSFTLSSFCTQIPLHTDTFPRRSLVTVKLCHIGPLFVRKDWHAPLRQRKKIRISPRVWASDVQYLRRGPSKFVFLPHIWTSDTHDSPRGLRQRKTKSQFATRLDVGQSLSPQKVMSQWRQAAPAAVREK